MSPHLRRVHLDRTRTSVSPAPSSLLLVALIALCACSGLPTKVPPQPHEAALPLAQHGALAQISRDALARMPPAQSGFALIDRAEDALRLRLDLAETAQQSLDVMYYLWWADDSGRLFLTRLIAAADRGVRVRILVDDLLLFGQDETLAALELHPNVSVRMFNPWRSRSLTVFAAACGSSVRYDSAMCSSVCRACQ